MTQNKHESIRYQEMYDEVEQIIRDINSDGLELDDLVNRVERGYDLIQKMKSRLHDTKLKVEKLQEKYESSGGETE